jgi:hypothetical protein
MNPAVSETALMKRPESYRESSDRPEADRGRNLDAAIEQAFARISRLMGLPTPEELVLLQRRVAKMEERVEALASRMETDK